MNAPTTIAARDMALIDRATTCAEGFDRLGKAFSADFTRTNIIHPLRCGLPGSLYVHWIEQQEDRLAGLEATHA